MKIRNLGAFALAALVCAPATMAADPAYDSLTANVVSGIADMKTGVSPILGGTIGLALFLAGFSLVLSILKARKPKVV